jgi:hypothetical protein
MAAEASAAHYYASRDPLCDDGDGYCLRDPSDSTTDGTQILMGADGSDKSLDYTIYEATWDCNSGLVETSPACPFDNGTGLNTTYHNDEIVYIENTNGTCIGGNSDTEYVAEVKTCPDDTNGITNGLYVYVATGDYFYLGNVPSGNDNGGSAMWLQSAGGLGANVYVDGSDTGYAFWYATAP